MAHFLDTGVFSGLSVISTRNCLVSFYLEFQLHGFIALHKWNRCYIKLMGPVGHDNNREIDLFSKIIHNIYNLLLYDNYMYLKIVSSVFFSVVNSTIFVYL